MMNSIKGLVVLPPLLLLLSPTIRAQINYADAAESNWVDSVYQALSPEERLGQLFMIRAHSNLGVDHIQKVKTQIREYGIGGLCFFQGSPEKQIELTNEYQSLSRVPLLVAMDAEWGLGMRLKEDAISYPRQMALGAIQDNALLREMGQEVGRQLLRLGVHVNFAPVVDINNDPANPVINMRSFGEDRYNVAAKGEAYARGMQEAGVLACAKHFPGHGDTQTDSHLDLPQIEVDRRRLDSLELYPFRVLARRGISSMMIAHLQVPALDDRPNRPTTLSRNTVTGLLREAWQYDGLIFTDAMEMKGVTKHFAPGVAEAEALLAGNDVLLLPEHIDKAIAAIQDYVAERKIDPIQVEASVKRILRSKFRVGLPNYQPTAVDSARAYINRGAAQALNRRLRRASLTMVRNQNAFLPIDRTDTLRMASLSVGARQQTPFQDRLGDYEDMPHFQMPVVASPDQQRRLLQLLGRRDVVFVSLHGLREYAHPYYGLTENALRFLDRLRAKTQVVITLFGTPYALRHFDQQQWLLQAYDEDTVTQDLAAQALFGAVACSGRLPVTASAASPVNSGLTTPKLFRMGYSLPEEMGMDAAALEGIAALAREAIQAEAIPGCQVLVARHGNIVYEASFGHHTYRAERTVRSSDLYDLASITKVAATTLSIMKLQESGSLDLSDTLAKHIPLLARSDKGGLMLGNIMAHRAGLQSWIPFYQATLSDTATAATAQGYYSNQRSGLYSVPVSDSLYMRHDYQDSIWQRIITSKLDPDADYRYSDLGFYLLSEIIRRRSGLPLDQYVNTKFYSPLGLQNLGFTPWKRVSSEYIVPSEEDSYFRQDRVQGYVHDMGAAMLGGVSGHAGLFSNARDLGVLMQMLLQGGFYGGHRYLQPETVAQYTQRHPLETRRAYGFDKPQLAEAREYNVSGYASADTFGHSGFTGTIVWADPRSGLLFVFLSNRTYPSQRNQKLLRLDTRSRMQRLIYQALGSDWQEGFRQKSPISTGS